MMDAIVLAAGRVPAAEIFRAYDIRGVFGASLSEEGASLIGWAIGSEARARQLDTVVVGRDGRLSSPAVAAAVCAGLTRAGVQVIDVGLVPTPVLYFAAKTLGQGSGVMITGSHNPPDYNGMKILLGHETLSGDQLQALHQRLVGGNLAIGSGRIVQHDIRDAYLDRVCADITLARPLSVVIDCGNGVAGAYAPELFQRLGCVVTSLYAEVDGRFPNHHPDPSKPENLADLRAAVAANQAQLGLAFDGDGDRVGVVTGSGKIIYPDRLMMLFARAVLAARPGASILFDVKCTGELARLIRAAGGTPVMCRTGHSFIKAALRETGAPLAGEMSGHIFFNDRWYGFDDALYAAARLLEILSASDDSPSAQLEALPEHPSTPEINIPVPDSRKFGVVTALRAAARFPEAELIDIDGLRVDFRDGWGLIRASNTTPCLVARFEGRDAASLDRIREQFRALLGQVAPDVPVAF